MVEILEAPPSESVDNTPDDSGFDEMVGHLYPRPSLGHALCGLPRDQDPHRQMHMLYQMKSTVWQGHTECPVCGAMVCPTCLAKARQARGEQ